MSINNISFKRVYAKKAVIDASGKNTLINWSDIQDQLIRLAAKHTKHYASDLLHDIRRVAEYLQDPIYSVTSFYFGFRNSGIDSNEYIELRYKHDDMNMYNAIYKLDIKTDVNNYIKMEFYRVKL